MNTIYGSIIVCFNKKSMEARNNGKGYKKKWGNS